MTLVTPQNGRQELRQFVRSLRERLKPSDIGLPEGTRRRTPGLRREEVAQLAGLSVTWYTWLEQGREISLSASALGRLAAALRLDRTERGYLFELAGKRDPDHGASDVETIPAAVLACVDDIRTPAYILDQTWTARAWNQPAAGLFAGWLDSDEASHGRNLLRFIFLAPAARTLILDFDDRARRVVAEFRADVSPRLGDPAIRRVIDELRQHSAEFDRYWNEHLVLGREGGERWFDHPRDGRVSYDQVTFAPAGRADVKLTILSRR
ncbi:MAG: helix-turn-helix transcriptional regulator [Alphaproteobacteria bacterium]